MSIHRLALSFARDFLPLPDHRNEMQKPKDKAETKQRHVGRGQLIENDLVDPRRNQKREMAIAVILPRRVVNRSRHWKMARQAKISR